MRFLVQEPIIYAHTQSAFFLSKQEHWGSVWTRAGANPAELNIFFELPLDLGKLFFTHTIKPWFWRLFMFIQQINVVFDWALHRSPWFCKDVSKFITQLVVRCLLLLHLRLWIIDNKVLTVSTELGMQGCKGIASPTRICMLLHLQVTATCGA